MNIKLKRLTPTATVPTYQTYGAAGMDLHLDNEWVRIAPLGRVTVSTGIALQIPEGFEGQIRPRSGLASKLGLTVLNTPGTIDSDYRGEIKVILFNAGKGWITLGHGDRVAQLVICPVQRVTLVEEELDETIRGEEGLGSTGV